MELWIILLRLGSTDGHPSAFHEPETGQLTLRASLIVIIRLLSSFVKHTDRSFDEKQSNIDARRFFHPGIPLYSLQRKEERRLSVYTRTNANERDTTTTTTTIVCVCLVPRATLEPLYQVFVFFFSFFIALFSLSLL